LDRSLGTLPPPAADHLEPEFEQLTRSEIATLQLDLLRKDLRRVWRDNRFYAARLRATSVDPDRIRSIADVREIPVVRKADILADAERHPPYGSRLQVPEAEIVEVVESSGTSGQVRETQALTAGDVELVNRAKRFQFYWVGCRKGTPVALHIPITMAAGALWSLRALQSLESNVLRLGNLEADARLLYMKRYRAEVTAASTSYIMRLEYAADATGFDLQRDLPALRSIYVGSGGWTVGWAEERARRWNARLFEVYGSSQRGFAMTCEWGILRGSEPGVLHFLPHLALTEVVDRETGDHVLPGEEGEIVITPFGQHGTPLIRYATGDRARYVSAADCPCGRQFDGIQAGSIGRYDDMLRLKDMNVWPEAVDDVVLAHPWVAEYRGDVYVGERARETVRVQVEFMAGTDRSGRDARLRELAAEVQRRIGIHIVCEEWSGTSLLEQRGIGFDQQTLKIRRWTDRRASTLESAGRGPDSLYSPAE
jgi:phenylacetate-CoA ligase